MECRWKRKLFSEGNCTECAGNVWRENSFTNCKGAGRLHFPSPINLRAFRPKARAICTCLLVFAAGCASTRNVRSALSVAHGKKPAIDTIARNTAGTTGISDTLEEASGDTSLGDPADLIEEAESYIADSDFVAADSTLKAAVRAIQTGGEAPDSSEALSVSSGLIDEIAALYKTKMPVSYKVPEDIGLAIFQRQMMHSLDSINLATPDSAALAALTCQENSLSLYDVPMVWNQRVRRALYFYLKNRDNTVDLWFQRAVRYLPSMKAMFADSGLPRDLAYLPLIESGFNPLAYSYANASGIWQFIASTGKLYGLKRSFWIDERRDPTRSTQAAVMYLKKLFGDFGHWHLALAAYNCGENGLARSIARSKSHDFWSLKRLPNQTKNYVPFYLAALTIAKNPKCFGVIVHDSGSPPIDTIRINNCISLSDIATGLNIDPDTLKKMNPHILRWCTPPDASNTVLYLPAGAKRAWPSFYSGLPPEKRVKWVRYRIKKGDTPEGLAQEYNVPVNALRSINRLAQTRIVPGHFLFVPMSDAPLGPDAAYSLPPEPEIKALDLPDYEFSGIAVHHRIRAGDNLGRIARRYHVSIGQLCRWNHVTGRTILRPGRTLLVSRPQPIIETALAPARVVSPDTSHAALAKVIAAPVPAPAAPRIDSDTVRAKSVASVPAPVLVVSSSVTHTVQIGETVFSLSRKYGVSLEEFASLNGLDLAHPVIKIGQVLKVTRAEGASPSTAASAAVVRDTAAYVPASSETTAVDSVTPPRERIVYYTVKQGDSLWRIATTFGVPVDTLYKNNNIGPDSVLAPGKVIKVVTTPGIGMLKGKN